MSHLNIASGQRKFSPPWTNVDINPRWEPDVIADGSNMPMFADNSAEMIVIHHGLEHAGCGESRPMLAECWRILKPGGSLLVFVPDMRMLAQGWLEGRISDQVYLTNIYGAFMGEEADRHKWGFTWMTLERELREAKFWPLPFDWRKIPGADIAGPEWWILGLEGFKR